MEILDKTVSKAKQSTLTLSDIEKAVKKAYKDVGGEIFIRHLWAKDDVHRFRVNWWENSKITTSKFLHITTPGNKVKIKEIN